MQRHLIAVGGAVRTAAVRLTRYRHTPALVAGFSIGVAGWSAAHPFLASFGFTRDVVAALLLAWASAFICGMTLSRRWTNDHGLPALLAAAWLVMLPTMLTAATFVVSSTSSRWLEHEPLRICLLTVAGLVAFGVPAACIGVLAKRMSDGGHRLSMILAAGLGIFANALLFAPLLGLHLPLLVVGVATAIGWLVRLARGTTQTAIAPSRESERPGSGVSQTLKAASMLLIGVSCAVSGRSLTQLFPVAAFLLAAGVGTFCVGAAAGSLIARRFRRHARTGDASRRGGAALAAIGVTIPLAVFPWLVNQHLDANAYVSSVFAMMSIRIATVVAAVLPISVGCGLIAARSRAAIVIVPLAAGVAAGGWIVPAFGVVPVAAAIGCGLLGLNVGSIKSLVPRTRYGWAMSAGCTAALIASISQVGNYEPTRAAQLLFSTEAFVSHQRGVPAELLPHLNDTRLVASFEEPRGTVTVWKRRGETFGVRLNGVPIASTSRRPGICPPPSGDVMSVAMPLILHQAPGSLLILGDAIGVSTEVAAGFPLREIVCYDGSVGLHESLTSRRAIAARDDRVTTLRLEPRLAVATERRAFDVVVSDPGPPAVLSNVPYYTQEFYRDAASRLAADGMFCQRLRYVDFGVEPLQVIAATMRTVFGDVLTLEIGPGEYALIGVRPGQSIIREGLTARLQRTHVRKMLASLGWDWCVPLNLLAVDDDGLKLLAEEAKGLNTSRNARFAYTLPQEMMRWGPKSHELARGTSNRTTRLLATAVPEDERRDVVDRIAEVTAQRELMVRYPDQPWAYRKEVRAKLVESPRSVIRPVSGEVKRIRHPDDQHRLDYFEALGKAIGKTSPSTLANLERFAEPYDPLVTYFLHHEIAALYGKSVDGGIAGELAHRLYAAYYADPRDRSVRDVATTLELIVSHPGALADEASRFDTLNSLIEVMLGRWEARGMAEPRSPEVVMVDIEKCLDAAQVAVDEMETLAASAGVSDDDWRLRKAAIERTMTRPLRKYRTTLLPHFRTAQRKAAALAEKAESTVE
ncbi:MAG: hypothetical protein M3552_12075 [Planctomycetota bacterium]|nr:hypothetical protein [Planctomycetaceae bacterium]MDQ3331372.1 hypothetical protein [Planctomycetota bacterium]